MTDKKQGPKESGIGAGWGAEAEGAAVGDAAGTHGETGKRLTWSARDELYPVTRETTRAAIHELLRLVLEWESLGETSPAGTSSVEMPVLRGVHEATDGQRLLRIAVNVLLQRRDKRRTESRKIRLVAISSDVGTLYDELEAAEVPTDVRVTKLAEAIEGALRRNDFLPPAPLPEDTVVRITDIARYVAGAEGEAAFIYSGRSGGHRGRADDALQFHFSGELRVGDTTMRHSRGDLHRNLDKASGPLRDDDGYFDALQVIFDDMKRVIGRL